jgi:hypothetical protein
MVSQKHNFQGSLRVFVAAVLFPGLRAKRAEEEELTFKSSQNKYKKSSLDINQGVVDSISLLF